MERLGILFRPTHLVGCFRPLFAAFAAILTFGLHKLSPKPASDGLAVVPYVVEVRCSPDQVEKVQDIFHRTGSTVRE